MQVLKQVSTLAGRFMAIIILAVTAVALVFPEQTMLVAKTSYVNTLLAIVMFGMGLTLHFEDFKVVFTRPKALAVGVLAQFVIMPLMAFLLCKVFSLPVELAVGVILVGACPGGTSSNVITYLAKGDVALSVGMTACTTLLAPLATPLLTLVFAGQSVEVAALGMFVSILQVVIAPIVAGVLVNTFFARLTKAVVEVLPLVSIVAISLILAAVVAVNAQKIMSVGLLVLLVVVLHNLLGYALGYVVGRVVGLTPQQMRAVSIEVGMQNSGLATTLALKHFAAYPLAAVPGAMFSIWHNISGALVANLYATMAGREEKLNSSQVAQSASAS